MTYSVRDICNRYAVDEHTVYAWINEGTLKAVNVGKSVTAKKPRWRITQEALDAFEALRTKTPDQPATRRGRKQDNNVIEFFK